MIEGEGRTWPGDAARGRAMPDAASRGATPGRPDLRVPMSRRAIIGAGGLAIASGAGLRWAGDIEVAYGGPTRSAAARSAVDDRSISWVPTARPWVGLTFDDGPDPATTPQVLDLLAEHGARATFFVVGRNVEAHPALVRRIVADGHTLGNHTADHAPLETLDEARVRDELVRGRAAIAGLDTGPRLVRPPRGYTSPLVARVARDLGEREVFWSVCLEAVHAGGDRADGVRLAETVTRGDVVLAHDGGHVAGPWAQTYDRAPTVRALAAFLDGLRRRGLTAVSVPELLAGRRP